MKKLLLLMCASLTMIACEQDELENVGVVSSKEPVQTKAATALSDFDQIRELVDLPLNIVHVKNSNYKYLSCAKSGNKVELSTTDDGSGRQRWYLKDFGSIYKYPLLTLKKGNSLCDGGSIVTLGADYKKIEEPKSPILKVANPFPVGTDGYGNFLRYNGDGLYIGWGTVSSNMFSQVSDLQATEDKGNLSYRSWSGATYPFENGEWMLVPVGDYKVVDVQYEKVASAGDYIIPKAVYCNGIVVGDEPSTITRSVSVSKTVESTSKFTESSKVTTQNQSSFGWSLGADVPLVHIGFNGAIDNTITNERTASYEESERESITITESYTLEFAPHTPCRVQIFKMTYNASLTYILTLEKVGGEESGRRFRIKGKWDGVVLSDMYFVSYPTNDDTEIDTSVIPVGTKTIRIGY